MKSFTVAKILRVLKQTSLGTVYLVCFTVAKILRVLKLWPQRRLSISCFTVAKILRVLKPQINIWDSLYLL